MVSLLLMMLNKWDVTSYPIINSIQTGTLNMTKDYVQFKQSIDRVLEIVNKPLKHVFIFLNCVLYVNRDIWL